LILEWGSIQTQEGTNKWCSIELDTEDDYGYQTALPDHVNNRHGLGQVEATNYMQV